MIDRIEIDFIFNIDILSKLRIERMSNLYCTAKILVFYLIKDELGYDCWLESN